MNQPNTSKLRICCWYCRASFKVSDDIPLGSSKVAPSTDTNRSPCSKGIGFNRSALITVKIEVADPMPIARASTTRKATALALFHDCQGREMNRAMKTNPIPLVRRSAGGHAHSSGESLTDGKSNLAVIVGNTLSPDDCAKGLVA